MVLICSERFKEDLRGSERCRGAQRGLQWVRRDQRSLVGFRGVYVWGWGVRGDFEWFTEVNKS